MGYGLLEILDDLKGNADWNNPFSVTTPKVPIVVKHVPLDKVDIPCRGPRTYLAVIEHPTIGLVPFTQRQRNVNPDLDSHLALGHLACQRLAPVTRQGIVHLIHQYPPAKRQYLSARHQTQVTDTL